MVNYEEVDMKIKDAVRLSVLMVWLILVGGCATIESGSNQSLTLNSNPGGAKVSVNGFPMGTTPVTLQLKRKTGLAIAFEKEGYQTISVPLNTTMNLWFLGNILPGGGFVFGSTTDVVSGAVIEYSPNYYMVTLAPKGESSLGGRVTASRSEKAKEFIVNSYTNILSNLGTGEVPYLSSLLNLLEISEDKRDDAVKNLVALSKTHPDVIGFADVVIGRYISSGTNDH
jgi:hypothetical protein